MTPSSIHHRHSIRLPGYDYSQPGDYFITICAYEHKWVFGEIVNYESDLSPLGILAQKCWMEIPEHFMGIELGVFVIMPNHIHGIITISADENTKISCRGTVYPSFIRACRAPTIHNSINEQFGKPVSGSIPTIIRAYKSAVTCTNNKQNGTPGAPVRQRNYYEHIIETEKEYLTIEAYIENNPANWPNDQLWAAKT